MNNYERIQKSIDFMEENLREPITLEDVARVTCFSLPHFYRLFNALVGRTIKDYLRLRRLSEAARDVASTGRSILDIALDYQFSSQESFSKAFRQAWGVSPGHVRRTKQVPESFARIDVLTTYFASEPESDGGPGEVDPSIKVVRYLGPFRVAYCRAFSESPEREAWDALLRWAGANGLLRGESPVRLFGFSDREPGSESDRYGYEAWITLDGTGFVSETPVSKDERIRFKEFTGGTYAVTRALAPATGMAWRNMYAWLQLSRYSLGAHQWLEEHLSAGSPASEIEVDLYLPLHARTKRGGRTVSDKGNRWVQAIEIETLSPMKVAYFRAMGTEPEHKSFEVMMQWAKDAGILGNPGTRVFGFNNPNPSPGSSTYGYEVWVTVPEGTRGSGEVRVKEVPGGKYAVGTTAPMFQGHVIPLAWQELGEWMRANKRLMGSHQWLEEHLNFEKDGTTGFENGLRMKLYCPLAE